MAYRKHFERQLETDLAHWCKDISFYLVDADCANFAWHVVHQNSVYEITYSDIGQITLSEFPNKHWPGSIIRDIYHGDNSNSSYQNMISLLSDNINSHYI
jgi:hypothetical protein